MEVKGGLGICLLCYNLKEVIIYISSSNSKERKGKRKGREGRGGEANSGKTSMVIDGNVPHGTEI